MPNSSQIFYPLLAAFALFCLGKSLSQGGGVAEFNPGTSIVGLQFPSSQQGRYLDPHPILALSDCSGLPIELHGNGTVFKAQDGLAFGGFDPQTGQPRDQGDVASAYWGMIAIQNCSDVRVRDFELDGNMDGLNLGGQVGNEGWQAGAIGLFSIDSHDVVIQNVLSHHHGEDGFSIGTSDDTGLQLETVLRSVQSRFNARQGLSWTGGTGLTVRDSVFTSTGMGRFASPPSAGVGMEHHVRQNGLFENCNMTDNLGAQVDIQPGAQDITLQTCRLRGETTLWVEGDGTTATVQGSILDGKAMVHSGTRVLFSQTFLRGAMPIQVIYADVTVQDATVIGSISADSAHDDLHSTLLIENTSIVSGTEGNSYLLDSHGNCLTARSVTVDATQNQGVSLEAPADGTCDVELEDMRIIHGWAGLPDQGHQSVLSRVHMTRVSFEEAASLQTTDSNWYIEVYHSDPDALNSCQDVFLSGPKVHWASPAWGPPSEAQTEGVCLQDDDTTGARCVALDGACPSGP